MATIYTIGYEGTDIKRFTATLVATNIKVLADVRAVAVSRKPGFSKKSLQTAVEQAGIEYRHFVNLGDPKEGRLAARAGQIEQFKKIYDAHLETDSAMHSLSELIEVVENSPTCLMCFERDPRGCHRSIVAARIATRGISVLDLFGDSPSRYVRNSKFLPSHDSYQGGAPRQ